MIYCSKCGTANRRGSRFCNECGELLPAHTTLRCPMCGAMNPVGNVYCDRCNARIVPLGTSAAEEQEQAPIKGLSLPTIPKEGQQEQRPGAGAEGTQDWLAQLRGSTVEEESPAAAGAEGSEDWLAQLRDSTIQEGPAEGAQTEKTEEEDWLSQLRASAEEVSEVEAAPSEPVEPIQIPDWLRGAGPMAAEAEMMPPAERPAERAPWEETAAPARPEPTIAETPDWLREIAPAEAAAPTAGPAVEEAAPTAPTSAPAEMSDWLRDLAPPGAAAPAAEETVPAAPAAPAPAETPDWLRDLALPKTAPATPAPAQAEMPDWLRGLTLPETAAPERTGPPPVTPALTDMPDWLRDMAAPGAAAPAAEETAPPAPAAPAPAEIPDWLRSMGPPATAIPEAAPPTSPFVEAPPSLASETPAWLAELKPGGVSATPTTPPSQGITPPFAAAPGIEAEEAGGLARADIPDWLQVMRPREEMPAAAAEEEVVETTGPLEGLRGVLAPAGEAAYLREQAPPAEVNEASLARAQMLQSLLTQPMEAPRPEARKRRVSTADQILRTLVRVLLAVAVVSVLLIQHLQENYVVSIAIPSLAHPTTSVGVKGVHAAVQSVSADTLVLIAFEYGPVEADELNVVAQPIVEHLLAQQAHVVIASTQPEGLAMAAGLMHVATDGMLYRPGGATGVAQLLADVKAQTGAQPGLILVLAAQPAPLRWWVEQTRALYGAEEARPIVAGVSAALGPVASPYLDAGQLGGMVSGLSGATAYEALRGTAGQAARRFNALAAGHAVIIALMLAGAVIYALAGPRRRER
jgi:hypothetical protein